MVQQSVEWLEHLPQMQQRQQRNLSGKIAMQMVIKLQGQCLLKSSATLTITGGSKPQDNSSRIYKGGT